MVGLRFTSSCQEGVASSCHLLPLSRIRSLWRVYSLRLGRDILLYINWISLFLIFRGVSGLSLFPQDRLRVRGILCVYIFLSRSYVLRLVACRGMLFLVICSHLFVSDRYGVFPLFVLELTFSRISPEFRFFICFATPAPVGDYVSVQLLFPRDQSCNNNIFRVYICNGRVIDRVTLYVYFPVFFVFDLLL